MTTTTTPDAGPDAKPRSSEGGLAGRKMSKTLVLAIPFLAIALTAGLFAVTELQGDGGFVVVTLLMYVALQTILSFTMEGPRQARDRMATTVIYVSFLIALVPLILIIWYTISRGMRAMSFDFLTHSMFAVQSSMPGGGATHAIIGTMLVSLIAAVIAVPLGIFTAIYLVEYGGKNRFGKTVSFFVDVMTGVPSIVSGLFIYAFWLLTLGFQKTALAGALSLVLLMLPIVVRSTEEMLKLVHNDLREAAYALGVPKWRTITKVVLPTAMSGIITGVMLGIARIMGETAPLLLLVGTSVRINSDPFSGQMETLPTYVNKYFGLAAGDIASANADRAWAAALTLIVLIMLLNLGARTLARFTGVKQK